MFEKYGVWLCKYANKPHILDRCVKSFSFAVSIFFILVPLIIQRGTRKKVTEFNHGFDNSYRQESS